MLVGQAVALDALVTLVPMLSSTLGFISLALVLVLVGTAVGAGIGAATTPKK